MIDFNRHIEIDNYLNGTMSQEEALAFEAKLSTDAALKQEFILQKSANLLVGNSAQLDLKNKLKNIHKQQKEQKSKKRVKAVVFALAAAVGVAIAAFMLYQAKNSAAQNTDPSSTSNDIELLDMPIETAKSKKEQTDPIEVEDFTEANESQKSTPETAAETEFKEEAEKSSQAIADHVDSKPNEQVKEREGSADGEVPNEAVDENNNNITGTNIPGVGTGPIDNDPCVSVNLIKPEIQIVKPAFGGEEGVIKLVPTEDNFIEYSVDGGQEFYLASDHFTVGIGNYQVVAKDENQCLSAVRAVEINYQKSKYVIQGERSRYMEIQNVVSKEPLMFEVRDGRSGKVVYTRLLENISSFLYQGVDTQSQALPLGTYVYRFMTLNGNPLSSGEITVIR